MTQISTTSAGEGAASLPVTLRLGPAHLTVADLEQALRFYEVDLGLLLHDRAGSTAALGAGEEDVLVLHEDPAARPAGRHAGLYHVALLYPSRKELARAVVRLAARRTPIVGASDHLTHEAVYLSDPEGNGLELAWDRPRAQWPPFERAYAGGPQPLDLPSLLAGFEGATPVARAEAGLRVGHVHLHVGDVVQGLAFYRDALGFDLVANLGTAAFVSAGGYHHHLAFNVWRGQDAPPVPEHVAGLRRWTVVLEDATEVAAAQARLAAAGARPEAIVGGFEVRDPWEIPLAVVVAGAEGAQR